VTHAIYVRLVFTSGRGAPSKGAALYVAKVNGGGIRRLTRPLFEDADPDWQLPAPGD
jgi:hypothetical protein